MDLLTESVDVGNKYCVLCAKPGKHKTDQKIVAGRGIVRFGDIFKTQTLPVCVCTLFQTNVHSFKK